MDDPPETPGPPAPPPPPRLAGRSREVAVLLRAFDRAIRGRGQTITIEGEAGIGKTSLLQDLLSKASARGMRCYAGAAGELERYRPFGAISEALEIRRRGPRMPFLAARPGGPDGDAGAGEEALRRELALLLSGKATGPEDPVAAGAPEAEFRIVDTLIDFVEHLCAAGPVVLSLDDLQWADPSTLLALNRLSREIARLPAVLIATVRPLPRETDLTTLLESMEARGALRVSLGALDDAAVADLVETLIGTRPGDQLLAQVARAGGNPFFTTELVASWQRAGAITLVNDVAEVAVTAPQLAPTLTNTILQRLSFLNEEALETLQVASILGSSFSVADLASAVGTRTPTLAPILSAAVRAGILGDDYPLLSFRHDLIREALYQSVEPALRAWWHLAAAQVLADGRTHEELAEHVIRGASPGDLGAVEWLQTAARQAAGRSPVAAAILLQRALDLAPAETLHRTETRADLAFYLLRCGRLVEAEAICRELLASARAPAAVGGHEPALAGRSLDEGRLRLCLVEATVGQGRIDQGMNDLEEAVAAPGLTDAHRARLWAWAAQCRVITWDLRGAADAARLALVAAARAHDDVGTSVALGNLAVVHHLRGECAEAFRLAQEALQRVAVEVGSPSNPFHSVLNVVGTLIDLDRLQDAEGTLEYWQRFRREQGAGWNHPIVHIVAAIGHFWSGEWDHAIASLHSGLDLAESTGIRLGAPVGHSLRCLIALHRGDLALAEREATAAEAAAAIAGPQWRPDWIMWARALLLEAGGEGAEALRVLTKAWALCSDTGVLAELPVLGPDLVRLALAGGQPLVAEEVTAAVEALAARAGTASINGAALRCRTTITGDVVTALAAVTAYRAGPRRRDLALACEDAAAALGTAGRTAEALPLATQALTIHRDLAAHRDLARAQARLRPLRRAPAARERARRGGSWDSLTPAERVVAALVAEGLNNPQIAERQGISSRTVQSHVSKILAKLGLTSRVEIAVQARGNPLPGPGIPPEPRREPGQDHRT